MAQKTKTPYTPAETHGFFNPITLARIFFILLTVWCGMWLAQPYERVYFLIPGTDTDIFIMKRWLYSFVAGLVALIFILFEHATDAISSHKLLMGFIGMFVGLTFSAMFYRTIPASFADPQNVLIVCNLIFGYFGVILAIKHAERFHLSRLKFFMTQSYEKPKVLDSSVIIDGRVRDLIEMQVIRGQILVPDFVIHEIQVIADSTEPSRRARGRRGLDVLESLRDANRSLELVDKDYPDVAAVDQKLVLFCQEMGGDLITNDYNLQKIAQLHRIHVININELANSLRPAVYIGELLNLNLVREGKEYGQGVGYLEDGTMVVVDEAAQLIGQEVQVIISSILQTSSGRLVFARLRESAAGNGESHQPPSRAALQ
ncbi:MAG: TRAM domain-containing protein [Candidatus Sumerlaeia bacterium]